MILAMTLISEAATTVASASVARPVIASDIPVPNLTPIAPKVNDVALDGGTGIVIAGTDVPTVGATARL